jgi:hypothetical protein
MGQMAEPQSALKGQEQKAQGVALCFCYGVVLALKGRKQAWCLGVPALSAGRLVAFPFLITDGVSYSAQPNAQSPRQVP